jgi:hypothetical protein
MVCYDWINGFGFIGSYGGCNDKDSDNRKLDKELLSSFGMVCSISIACGCGVFCFTDKGDFCHGRDR